MYFYKIDESALDDYRYEAERSEWGRKTYEALTKGEYDIYSCPSPLEEGGIRYIAIPKKKDAETPFISFDLTITKEITNYRRDCFYYDYGPVNALAVFLAENDKDASEEKLRLRYGEMYERYLPFASLSKEQAEGILSARDNLLALKKSLVSNYKVGDNATLHIHYSFFLERGDYIGVRLKAGFSKLYAVNNIDNFVTAVKAKNYLSIGSGKQIGERDSYEVEEKGQEVFSEFASHKNYRYSYNYNQTSIPVSSFVSMLFLLIGESVDIDAYPYLVDEAQEESVSIDEKGRFLSSLAIKKDDVYFVYGDKAVVIDKRNRVLSLHHFPSKSAATLFEFSASNRDFPYEFFASSIGEDIVPLLDEGTKIDESFKIAHPSAKSEIEYSVSYEENGTLLLKTRYTLSLREVSEEDFTSSGEGNALRLKRFLLSLEALGLKKEGVISDENSILLFLNADLSMLSSSCKLLLSENLANRKPKKLEGISIKAESGEDWFSASLESDKYSPEELEAIYSAYKKKKKYVHFRGSFITLDDDNIVKELSSDFSLSDFGKKLPLYQALKLDNYKSKDESLTSTLRSMLVALANYKDFPLTGLSPSLEKTLRPYQKDGVKWLLSHDKYELGGLLADEMGLGKTLESIAFLSLKEAEGPILIVSPKSLIYNWASEFSLFDPSKKVHVVDGDISNREKAILCMKKAENEVFIMSYDSLRNDIEKLKGIEFAYLFLDEAQFIANAFAKKSKAVKELKSKHRFVLTGTPIQNNLLDLWSIFDFLLPGYLPSYKDFKAEYGDLSIKEESSLSLARKVAPFYLQRKKTDVLKELPPKEEKRLIIALNEDQRGIYEAHLRKTRELLKGTKEHHEAKDRGKDKIAILAALTRLREICVDPSMLLDGASSGAKFESLKDNISIALSGGHKVLIFSSYVKALMHLGKELEKEGVDSYLIYGDVSAKERLALASRFNDENDPVKVMLVSLKAGGTGLNLIGADIVYHLDPWWNVAAENQASDRAHRMGQKKKVTIFKMIAKDTIEEKVISLQEKKQDLASILSKSDSLSLLSEEDIMYLLS